MSEVRRRAFDAVELKTELIALFRSADYQPPVLPSVAMDLLALSRQAEVSVDAIADLMGRDPMLAGHVLRIAQSAARSGRQPLRSLREAIVRLGVRRVSDLFLRACAETKVFHSRAYAPQMEALRRHSVFTGEVARLISRRTKGSEDEAYLCGLLHDVGVAAALLAMETLKVEAPFELVWPSIWELHESCSEYLGRVWSLPSDVIQVMSLHHSLVLDGNDHTGAVIVALADGLAHEMGFGLVDAVDMKETEAVARIAGLDKAALAKLRDELSEMAPDFRA
jgi:HD-like signal output (HDOD) protein